ncbi:MAG: 6-carboxytetrahydropterin synthase QueD [Proteobacteria bacterium]|nr:6-carboxytetrahydropterin synthase QueD [Pseudomonadota bacterium]
MFEVMIKTEFASAHNLRDYKGACEAMHGHNWKIDILVEAKELDATGLAVDFNVLKEKSGTIIGDLDHIYLNEHTAFKAQNPSSENIAKYIFDSLKKDLPDSVKLKKITVWETDDAAASYYED